MACKENKNMGMWMNAPGTMMPWYMMPGMQQSPYYKPGMPPMLAGSMAYKMIYPDIYYKLQPYIMMGCDQMDMYGENMPDQDMMDKMTDSIYDNVCSAYPDLNQAAQEYAAVAVQGDPFDYDERFRRRRRPGGRNNMLRDLIGILFLSELFDRRRRRFPIY